MAESGMLGRRPWRRVKGRLLRLPNTLSAHPDPVPILRRRATLSDPVLGQHKRRRGSLLPEELFWEILKWLPVKSLMRFKCVSRAWLSIITDPAFAGEYRGGFKGILSLYCFRLQRATRRDFYCISPENGEITPHSTVDHGSGNFMGFTNIVNGLTCFYNCNHSYLYNIATRETMQLPDSTSTNEAAFPWKYHFGFDPVDKLYKLLKVYPVYDEDDDDEDDDGFFACEVLTIGLDSAWRNIGPGPWTLRSLESRSICIDGVLYWSVKSEDNFGYCVFAFHIVEEKFQLIPLILPREDRHFLWSSLPIFGPIPALISLGWSSDVVEASILLHNNGKWADKLNFKIPHEYRVEGVFPNGKWLIFPTYLIKQKFPAPFFLFDPIKGELEKIVMHIPSPFSFSSIFKDGDYIFGNLYYHEDNIIPLRNLIASNS